MEENFFRERDQELLEYLRSQAEESNLRSQLSEISGIVDTEVLDALIRAGITAESLSALSLLPMVPRGLGRCESSRHRTSSHSPSRDARGCLRGLNKLPIAR